FFQAEDGIRDGHVTGVQTCALPIFRPDARARGSFARGFAASPPRIRETTDTAASPYTRSRGRSWRWASAKGSATTKTRRSATIAPRAAMYMVRRLLNLPENTRLRVARMRAARGPAPERRPGSRAWSAARIP